MSLTSGLFNPKNRFGFHTAYLQAVSPHFADRTKADCYIPTRLEVYRLPMAELHPLLDHWFLNAPSALAPTVTQKQAVIRLLHQRPDHARHRALIDALAGL